jgi:hypothetical protein
MPIVNADAARWSNATMAANAHEVRVTPTVGAGKEAMKRAGENATMAAQVHESRCQQEIGTH